MIFAGIDVAARIERAECRMLIDCTDAIRRNDPDADVLLTPVGSGFGAFGGAGSPVNKIAGLGFDTAPPNEDSFASQLEALEQAWFQRGSPVQVELSCLADPSIGALLTKRGYILRGFENVLGCALPRATPPPRPSGESIEVSINPPEKLGDWIDTVVAGFATPDTQGIASHESFPREAIDRIIRATASAAGFTHFLARRNGEVAGGASLRIFEGIAQMCGAATIPQHRRRGVQGALLGARLDAAARAGCKLAIVTTLPGSKSQENVQRRGFELLYTRAILVRDVA